VPSDPAVVRSIAVTSGDVVAALELTLTSDDEATLRITPPFSARMRARLHVDRSGHADRSGSGDHTGQSSNTDHTDRSGEAGDRQSELPGEAKSPDGDGQQDEEGETASRTDQTGGHGGQRPLYIDPEQLVADPPEYPRPTDTRKELLADPERSYTVERHHEYHARAVEEWRESIPGCIRDQFVLETPGGPTDVQVRTLESDLV
jgi:hypothetical protein